MINVQEAFILVAKCAITYDGRAKSTLIPGDYLIIHKKDGTLLIHGNSRCTALNYQPPKARLILNNKTLTSTRKGETITIEISEILYYQELPHWSNNDIEISMTEADLKKQIISQLPQLLNKKVLQIIEEFQTDNGPVDLLVIDEDYICNAVEIKRKKAGIRGCTQLTGYVEHFSTRNLPHQGWLMSPSITQKAQKYCLEHSLRWVPVQHALQPPSAPSL